MSYRLEFRRKTLDHKIKIPRTVDRSMENKSTHSERKLRIVLKKTDIVILFDI